MRSPFPTSRSRVRPVLHSASLLLLLLASACAGGNHEPLMAQISRQPFELSKETDRLWREDVNDQLADIVGLSNGAVLECDRLAADPLDSHKVVSGIDYEAIETAKAIEACSQAMRENPEIDRYKYQLARVYARNGKMEQAIPILQGLADRNYTPAQEALGSIFLARGRSGGLNLDPAVALIRKAAEAGNPNSQWMLGGFHIAGKIVQRDTAEGLRWLTMAAESGHPRARSALARLYLSGIENEFDADIRKSVHFMKQAEAQGEPEATYLLALLYLRGHGVEKDLNRYFALLQKAARKGNPLAQASLAAEYMGHGPFTPDRSKAFFWLIQAMKSRVPIAIAMMADLREQLTAAEIGSIYRTAKSWAPPAEPVFPRTLEASADETAEAEQAIDEAERATLANPASVDPLSMIYFGGLPGAEPDEELPEAEGEGPVYMLPEDVEIVPDSALKGGNS